ncbi:MAG: dihydrolipoamide acetyltransferase family protein [Halanaeroarchaeum sp.]
MTREFALPDVGEGISEGEIVSWLVEPGETVTEDQPIAEVETDKAVVEVPAPLNGTVVELHYEPGTVVEVGDVIVTFAEDGEGGGEISTGSDGKETAPAERDGVTGEGDTERTFAPPSVRKLARELDVDLDAVTGTGPSGRVTEADVREAASTAETPQDEGASAGREPQAGASAERAGTAEATSTGRTTAKTATGPTTAETQTGDRDRTLAVPATRRVARESNVDIDAVPAVEEREGESFVTAEAVREYAERQRSAQAADADVPAEAGTDRREERIPYRGVRQTIGERMEESKYTAPHVTHHDTVDVTDLVEARDRLRETADTREVTLTYLPFVMKAVVAALKDVPELNSSLDEEAGEIVRKYYYDIGVAVATDAGLMVPVVEDVDKKGILEIAETVNRLAAAARERSIDLDDLRGSTFSITNFGAIGGEYATPIINYPEVGILGLGAIEKRPTVHEGEVQARHTLPLSLSIDHRVVDGATAAEFTNRVMTYLETPTLLLLE